MARGRLGRSRHRRSGFVYPDGPGLRGDGHRRRAGIDLRPRRRHAEIERRRARAGAVAACRHAELPLATGALLHEAREQREIIREVREHGFEIAAFGVKEVVPGEKTANVKFVADKAGIFPIKCQLHPAHVVGQFVVLE
jgi:hypothetical protein